MLPRPFETLAVSRRSGSGRLLVNCLCSVLCVSRHSVCAPVEEEVYDGKVFESRVSVFLCGKHKLFFPFNQPPKAVQDIVIVFYVIPNVLILRFTKLK